MKDLGYEVITRDGVDPTTAPGKPPLPPIDHVRFDIDGLCADRNIPVRLRDGTTIYVDLYRPQGASAGLPALLAWGPYGKHFQSSRIWPAAGVEDGWISELTGFESPDPVYWCGHGYAVTYADPRGLWRSEGAYSHNGPQEAEDVFDTIEWLGAADWSNGRVGMLGVSYLAGIQYLAASVHPPSLKAISPWECFADWYRELAYHGGIPETGFLPRVSHNVSYSLYRTEDTYANIKAHPLMHDYYRDKYGDLSRITVPAYVVASWSDHGLHSRGTLDAFERISSEHKWLEVHGQKKWRHFYAPESVERQRAFFDHFLLDRDTELKAWPRVRMEIRDRPGRFAVRDDLAWPVPVSWATRLHLDVGRGSLAPEPPEEPSAETFDPRTQQFDASVVFSEDTTIVGPMRLRLWLSVDEGDDADVFVALRKFDREGAEVRFPFNALFDDGPVALGWLRASHRELDEQASTQLRPVHPHEREEPLVPGQPVSLDIELWPSGTVFHAGEQLTVTLLGRDFVARPPDPMSPVIRHEDVRNGGRWTIRSGGGCDSWLSLAHVPAQTSRGVADTVGGVRSLNESDVEPAALADRDHEMDVLPRPSSVHDRFFQFIDRALRRARPVVGEIDPMVIKLSLLLRKVAQLMSDDANWMVHRPAGWTQASYRICFTLWVSGPMPPHKVAESTNMSRASISAGMKRIFEAGFITKEPHKDDLRSTVLKLTDKGRDALESAYLAHLGLETNWFSPLTDAERLVLFMLLEKMLSGDEAQKADSRR